MIPDKLLKLFLNDSGPENQLGDKMSTLSTIYREIIQEVLEKVKPDFLALGYEQETLNHLQRLWESKLMASGAVSQGFHRTFLNQIGDIPNVLLMGV